MKPGSYSRIRSAFRHRDRRLQFIRSGVGKVFFGLKGLIQPRQHPIKSVHPRFKLPDIGRDRADGSDVVRRPDLCHGPAVVANTRKDPARNQISDACGDRQIHGQQNRKQKNGFPMLSWIFARCRFTGSEAIIHAEKAIIHASELDSWYYYSTIELK